MDYRYSHLAEGKGVSYHNSFSVNPYRSFMWKTEKKILDEIVDVYFGGKVGNHLDFACGTGRILSHIEKNASSSVGIDVSESMLEEARKHSISSEIMIGDITRDDPLGDRKFDLITAFRFFPNAQRELRYAAIAALTKHLADGGCLVFNNHRNYDSLYYRLLRFMKKGGDRGMQTCEVYEVLDRGDLNVDRVYHAGVVPSNEGRQFFPMKMIERMEYVADLLPLSSGLYQNVIYVCRSASY